MGRVQGAFGEANQHSAVVVLLLPAMFAKAMLTRGAWRMFWGVGAMFAVAAVFMTASRGAMLGILLAGVWGAFVFRRFISLGKLTGWIGVSALVVSIVLVALSATYTQLLTERVFSLSFGGNAVDASSGRTEIWATALHVMAESPWTFVTGFGWNVYSSMDFEYAPHNTYLGFWFNLGLPGLLAFLLVLVQAMFTARSAAEVAPASQRPYMVAFVIGFMALCISIFFVELTEPWPYVWAYVGLSMRAAVCIREEAAVVAAPKAARAEVAAVPRVGGRSSLGAAARLAQGSGRVRR
jgi:O-antigen ligase